MECLPGFVWYSTFSDLEKIHVRAAKIYGLDWLTPSDEVLLLTKWNTLKQMHIRRVRCIVYKSVIGDAPLQLRHLWSKQISGYNLRRKNCLVLPKPNKDFVKKSLAFEGALLWNSLDNETRLEESLACLKSSLRSRRMLAH